jgi:HEAT repeat protein
MTPISPAATYAIVVGIEKYDAGKAWSLDGPANDAVRFLEYLASRGVPRDNVWSYLAPLEVNAALSDAAAAHSTFLGRPIQSALDDFIEKSLPALKAELLFLFWSGHGFGAGPAEWRLFLADARANAKRTLDLSSLLAALRTNAFPNLPRQAVIVDACANYPADPVANFPGRTYAQGKPLEGTAREQYVLYAASTGEYARNRNAEKDGLFSKELMDILDADDSDGAWPPDLPGLAKRLADRFKGLRAAGKARQSPYAYWYDIPNSRDQFYNESLAPRPANWTAMPDHAALRPYLGSVGRRLIEHLRFYEGRPLDRPESFLVEPVFRKRSYNESPASGSGMSEGVLPDFLREPGARLLVVAAGGAGKTTALLRYAADAAARAQHNPSAPVPIVARLQQFGNAGTDFKGLITMLVNASAPLPWSEETLIAAWRSGEREFIFLLDGLNEVPKGLQGKCVSAIRELAQQPSHRYLVTSRPGRRASALLSEPGFEMCEILPLDAKQIRQFLAQRDAAALFEQLGDNLKDLAGNPFMLLALTRISAGHPGGALPANMGQLYRAFLEGELFGKREVEKQNADFDYQAVKKPILCYLASCMTASGITRLQRNDAIEDEVTRRLQIIWKSRAKRKRSLMPKGWSTESFMDEIVTNGVLLPIPSTVEFINQSVQEFFTAAAFVNAPEELAGRVAPFAWRHLDADDTRQGSLADPYAVPAAMLSGLLENSTPLVEALFERNQLTAAACIGNATALQPELVRRCREHWLGELGSAGWRNRWVACTCLGEAQFRNLEVIDRLVALIAHENRRKGSVRGFRAYRVIDAAEEALRRLDPVRAADEIVKAVIASDGLKPPGFLHWPVSALNKFKSPAAIERVAEAWRTAEGNDKRIIAGLLSQVRRTDVLAALGTSQDPDQRELLHKLGKPAPDLQMGKIVAEARAWIESELLTGRTRLQTAPDDVVIAELANPSWPVRRAAAEELGKRRPPGAAERLLDAVRKERHSVMMPHLARALAACVGDEHAARLLEAGGYGEDALHLFDLDPPCAEEFARAERGADGFHRAPSALAQQCATNGLDVANLAIEPHPDGWLLESTGYGVSREIYLARAGPTAISVEKLRVRAGFVFALSGIASAWAVPALVRELQADDASVRRAALYAIKELGAVEAARPAIENLLRHEIDAWAMKPAIEVLGSLVADPPLEALLDAAVSTPYVLDDVHKVLKKCGARVHSRLRDHLRRMLSDEGARRRVVAAVELANLRKDDLSDPAAGTADETADNALLLHLVIADPEPEVRAAGAEALRWARQDVLSPLIAKLEARDPRKRAAAATALGSLEDPRAVDALQKMLADATAAVRLAAATAIVEIEPPTGVDEALKALLAVALQGDHADTELRQDAAIRLKFFLRSETETAQQLRGLLDDLNERCQWDELLEVTGRALELFDVDVVTVRLYRMQALAELERYEEALSELEAARRAAPSVDKDATIRVALLRGLGRDEEAAALMKEAVAQNGSETEE